MPGRGPAPSATHTRARNDHKLAELVDTGELFGEPLPPAREVLGPEEEWHPQTVKWWDAMRRNPMLRTEPEVGWQFLLDTALLHNTMWSRGRWEFAAEVRLRVAKYGVTPEDRMRLKVQVVTPKDGKDKKPVVTDELAQQRRKRLASG